MHIKEAVVRQSLSLYDAVKAHICCYMEIFIKKMFYNGVTKWYNIVVCMHL